MKVEDTHKKIAPHPDMVNEKTKLEHFINSYDHASLYIPQYYCELNLIKHVCSQAKRHTQAYCNYSITSLRQNIPEALDSVSVENIFAAFKTTCMGIYLDTSWAGIQFEELVNKFSKQVLILSTYCTLNMSTFIIK